MKEGKSYDTVVDMNSNMCYDNFCDIPPPQTEQTKELIPRVEYVSFDLENTELCMFQISFFYRLMVNNNLNHNGFL